MTWWRGEKGRRGKGKAEEENEREGRERKGRGWTLRRLPKFLRMPANVALIFSTEVILVTLATIT